MEGSAGRSSVQLLEKSQRVHPGLQYGQIYIPMKALLNTFHQRKDRCIVSGELQRRKKKKKIKNDICNLWWMMSYVQHTLMAIHNYGLVGELVANLVRFRDGPLRLFFYLFFIYVFFFLKNFCVWITLMWKSPPHITVTFHHKIGLSMLVIISIQRRFWRYGLHS